MKRPPREGEPALHHLTVDTGHEASFAICDENFNPEILRVMRRMTTEPVSGYMLEIPSDPAVEPVQFYATREDGTRLTLNVVFRDTAGNIWLETSFAAAQAAHIDPDEAYMLSDLEQCAALMLLRGEG